MNDYGIKRIGYIHRTTPAYFNDTLPDSAAWQADVYRLAAMLAKTHGIQHLIDLGCGRGEKLIQYADSFTVTGIDIGANIDYAHEYLTTPRSLWATWDLNSDIIYPSTFNNTVVICADVIEHLPDPTALLQTLSNACATAACVLVSTPDRLRVYKGEDHPGPPGNPYHCREWSNDELYRWFLGAGLPVKWHGWTISNDARPDQVWTSLLVMSQQHEINSLPERYESAEWNPAL